MIIQRPEGRSVIVDQIMTGLGEAGNRIRRGSVRFRRPGYERAGDWRPFTMSALQSGAAGIKRDGDGAGEGTLSGSALSLRFMQIPRFLLAGKAEAMENPNRD